jgi:hypothetical protein
MRHEFSRQTKREALRRSGGLCEAVGEVYGLDPSARCNGPLSHGVEFDHYPLPAGDKGSDTIGNCVAVCLTCHRWKTSHYDIPVLAKGKRISDRHLGITVKSKWGSRGFPKAAPQLSASTPHHKHIGEFEDSAEAKGQT